ncbi:MAG: CYTH domain-containing protein, partial [Acholeplasmataceae bacterium]|nr:CYTH domain-containing protein [Acholeplasmataceae bacterium]
MTKNIEIEFKTALTIEKYQELLELFHLENNIFKQINHYFDTDDYQLMEQQIVLRIRQKGENRFKVTLKSQSDKGAYE